MDKNLIQVLWVEDDPEVTRIYPLEAAHYGLQLIPFGCWKDAEEALMSDFKRWSAIILDAKCKYKRDSTDNAAVFLTQAMHAIDKICTDNHRIIPWYVLSGGSEEELNDLIIDSREEWDGDWKQKKYYSKDTDRDMLFHRIPYHARVSPEMQIRIIEYPDVFNAIKKMDLGDDMEIWMEELLMPIHTHKYSGKEYNNLMTNIRKCIERIYMSMAQYGLLPNKKQGDKLVLHDVLVDRRGSINSTWCSKILGGKEDNKLNVTSTKIIPNTLKDSFYRLTELAASYEHATNKDKSEEQKQNTRDTASFLEYIGNAPYLLRSMTMELCCIVLWYARYISEHDDEEINALNWEVEDISNKLSNVKK